MQKQICEEKLQGRSLQHLDKRNALLTKINTG